MARAGAAADASDGEARLATFLARYTPEIQERGRAARAWMARRLPGATQLVYDNYNALVIGFGPSERASEAPFSIALYPRWVTLFFLQGAGLPDPRKLLRGSGVRVRSIVLDSADVLDRPEVGALIDAALLQAGLTLQGPPAGRVVVRAVAPTHRARKPAAKKSAGAGAGKASGKGGARGGASARKWKR